MTQHILDSMIRRESHLQRFGTFLISEYIDPTMKRLSIDIPKELVGLPGATKADYNKTQRIIKTMIAEQYDFMWSSVTGEFPGMMEAELEFMQQLYTDFDDFEYDIPPTQRAFSTAMNGVMVLTGNKVDSGLWEDFLATNLASAQQLVAGVVAQGWRDGQTINEITRNLRGTYNRQTKQYQGGVINGKLKQYARTIARTGVSHFSNRGRDSFALTNEDRILFYVFFATLDNRTTTICLGNHLKKWKPRDKSRPELPLHYNERSVYVFQTPSLDPTEFTRPVISGRKSKAAADRFEERQSRTDRKVRYKGRKDNDIFDVQQIQGTVTADEWMRRQPEWFVESSLGAERAKLFLNGKLPLDKFTNTFNRPLTLDELRETSDGEAAFRRANL